jgi:hypothetical protein
VTFSLRQFSEPLDWILYICFGAFWIYGTVRLGRFTFRSLPHLRRYFVRHSGEKAQSGMTDSLLVPLISISSAIAFGVLVWIFFYLFIFEGAQVVRFEDHQITLIYRWPWLTTNITYNDIEKIELEKGMTRPSRGMMLPPLKIAIITKRKTYEINPSYKLRDQAQAIYDELLRHQQEFSHESYVKKEF